MTSIPWPRLAWCAALLAGTSAPAVAQAPDSTPPPPCAAPEHRAFDFWIGEWDVTTPDGVQAGRSTVAPILDGCVVHETWAGARGMHGQSFNVYDATTKTWRQSWVDSRGGVILMEGGLERGHMVLTVRHSTWWKGTPRLERWRWTPLDADHVRQLAETSEDEGRTWKTLFDGRYARRH